MGWKRDARRAMRKQRQQARMSKRQAKRLRRIYKDMSPEEIAEMNAIAPEIATGSAQIGEQGQENDPVATMAAYNSEMGSGSGEGQYYPEDADYLETFQDVDYFENMEDAEANDGGDGDPYSAVIGGIGGIIDQFRQNFERNKPENFDRENLVGPAQENLFGLDKFWKQLTGKGKELDEQRHKTWAEKHGYIKEQAKKDSMENAETGSVHFPVAALLVDAAIAYAGYYVYEKHHKLVGGVIFGVGALRAFKTMKAYYEAKKAEGKK